jgi:hypothetical protein
MNPLPNHGPASAADRSGSSTTGEDTLRFLALLPAPEGLEDRVKAGLRSSPQTGRTVMGRGLQWQFGGGWMYSGFARGAAAAAIVVVVAGGGWEIYSRVQPAPTAAVVPVQPSTKGFSNANAVRVPETLDGPKLKHPLNSTPEVSVMEKTPAQPQSVAPAKKKQPHARPAPVK